MPIECTPQICGSNLHRLLVIVRWFIKLSLTKLRMLRLGRFFISNRDVHHEVSQITKPWMLLYFSEIEINVKMWNDSTRIYIVDVSSSKSNTDSKREFPVK